MGKNHLVALSIALISLVACGQPSDYAASDKIAYYEQRYNLPDTDTKLVNNVGQGYLPLYGTRNFRAVLKGVAYRGGANNLYHHNKRANENPLPNDGLMNLCNEGFKNAVYLYPTNYSTAPKQTNCSSSASNTNALSYLNISPFGNGGAHSILKLVFEAIQDQDKGPIYVHCWNGWHASGLISALMLKQFCGYTSDEAVAYWDRNTDGVNKGTAYDNIRNQIRQFNPYSEFKITANQQARICY